MNARLVAFSCALSLALLGACETERVDPPHVAAAWTPPGGEVVPVSLPPTSYSFQTKLVPGVGGSHAQQVDLDGDTAIVSSSGVGAHVYTRTAGVWGAPTPLNAAIGAADLGVSVAIEGDLAVLGAPGFDDTSAANVGAFVAFERNAGSWSQAGPPVQSPVQIANYNFGRAVAISNGRIIVGAPKDSAVANSAGAIYVYGKNPSSGAWEPLYAEPIRPAGIGANDELGRRIAVDGDWLVAGVPRSFHAGLIGSVFVIDLALPSWSVAELDNSSATGQSDFGSSVAVAGDTIVVGAPGHGNLIGAAFVFEHDGVSWQRTELPHTPSFEAQFGAAVAVDPPWAIVTAIQETVNQWGDGAVHVFGHDGTSWTARQKLTGSPLPNLGSLTHNFGQALALRNGTALVAWPKDPTAGATWAYVAVGDACSQPGDCPGGLCVHGFCCNNGCIGSCLRCDVAGAEGTCSPAAGHPGDPLCAPYVCDGSGAECPTSCTQNNQCDDESYCLVDECKDKKNDGAPCTDAAQCLSGFCVDGHCCDGPCGSPCQACDAAGSVGTCTIVTGAPHGNHGPCPADSCSDGVEAVGSVCAGDLTCAPPTESPCAPYACGETACRTSCTLPEHCLAGYVCDFESGTCRGDSPICEGDRLQHPDGSATHCAPYRCTAAGACLTACTSSGDCAGGHVCASNGTCVEAPSFLSDGGCALSGRGEGAWLVLALLALATMRRRA